MRIIYINLLALVILSFGVLTSCSDSDNASVDGDLSIDGDGEGNLCDPNPCGSTDNRVCDMETGNCVCKIGYCDIDGKCYADGAANPAHTCQICDSEKDSAGWSLAASNVECRESAGACDMLEFCDGKEIDCPDDEKQGTDVICRAGIDACDVAENCDGAGDDCPEDQFAAADLQCDDEDNCTSDDVCDGSGVCVGTAYGCNGHGECNVDDDVCSCASNYSGDYCAACAANYIDYPNCLIDMDSDGIPEDDGDGNVDFCTGGLTANCDDNCPALANEDQTDVDSDGLGDDCDDDPPGDVSIVAVCVGGATGSESFQLENENCSAEYACNGSFERCNRRNGTVLVFWDAPAGNVDLGTGQPSDYEIHAVKNEDCADAACICDGITWDTANEPTDLTVELATTQGAQHSAVISGLDVSDNTSYCILIKAFDAVGNESEVFKIGREVNFVVEEFVTLANLPGPTLNDPPYLDWGDFNGDGLDDMLVGTVEVNGFEGALRVYYGREDDADVQDYPADQVISITGSLLFGGDIAVGNFNGDETADGMPLLDVAVGSYEADSDGSVYLFFGQEDIGLADVPDVNIDHISDSSDDFRQLGFAIEALNWNGDEYTDLVLGTYSFELHESPVYLFLGRESWDADYTAGSNVNPAYKGDEDLVIQRDDADNGDGGFFGWDLAATDMNDDGFDEIIMSHLGFNDVAGDDRIYVLWGDPTLTDGIDDTGSGGSNSEPDYVRSPDFNVNVDFSIIIGNGDFGKKMEGVPSVDSFGSNGDPGQELMVQKSTNIAQETYIYRGTAGEYEVDASPQKFISPNNLEEGSFGETLGWAGDFNMDGFNDVFITDSSMLWVVWGDDAATLADSYTVPGLFDDGEKQMLHTAGGGDFNGDGMPDLVAVNKANGKIFIIK